MRVQASRDTRKLSRCLFAWHQNHPERCDYPALKVNTERRLRDEEVARVTARLKVLNFWTMPPEVAAPPMFDGVRRRLEGLRDGETRAIERKSPPYAGVFYDFGACLLDLAGVTRPDAVLPRRSAP